MLQCGTDKQTNEQLKIELLSQWKLEAEFRNTVDGCTMHSYHHGCQKIDISLTRPFVILLDKVLVFDHIMGFTQPQKCIFK